MHHHAHLLVADSLSVVLDNPAYDTVVSPDVFIKSFKRFSIKDARWLARIIRQLPVKRLKRLFYLHFESINHEAQHALLKLLEEPPSTAEFFIIVSHKEKLLPTVRSRLQPTNVVSEGPTTENTGFVSASLKVRLEMISDAAKSHDLAWFHKVRKEIEHHALAANDHNLIKDVKLVSTHDSNSSASLKMLFEYLALSL